MKCITPLFALALSPLALVVGCNTAQFSEPPPTDSGTGICPAAPVIDCDASGVTSGCGGDLDAGIASGALYPFACVATSRALDPLGECAISNVCTCATTDASASDDGGATGASGAWACNH